MAAFSWSSIPWWGWVLLVLAVVVIVPIKLKILKSLFGGSTKKNVEQDED